MPPPACSYWTGWALFGFFTGAHWAIGWRALPCERRKARRHFFLHAAFYWCCTILFWVFRMTMLPWYLPCPSGDAMNVTCLFRHQTKAYAAFYTIHIVLLVMPFVHWVIDAFILSKGLPEKVASTVVASGGDEEDHLVAAFTALKEGKQQDDASAPPTTQQRPLHYVWATPLAAGITLVIIIGYAFCRSDGRARGDVFDLQQQQLV